MKEQLESLPIKITEEQRMNGYAMQGIIARAFQAAGYDMVPEHDALQLVQRLRLISVVESEG